MIMLTLERFGCYLITDLETEREILIKSDWDFPGVASVFGWSPCHRSTDGTIDCQECGKRAGTMIAEAAEYLDGCDGATAEDPGYFDSEGP
jgi:hypothetical protein